MINLKNSISTNRILICGLGSIGSRHLRLIKEFYPSIKIGLLRSGKGNYRPESLLADFEFKEINDSIKWRPNGVIISSPAIIHLKQALLFLKNKIPVFIEKPLGIGLGEDKLIEEIKSLREEIPVLVGYVFRFEKCLQVLRKYIQNKSLGVLVDADFYCGSWLPSWRQDFNYEGTVSARKNLGGGALLELSHELDIANWIFGKLKIRSAYLSDSKLLNIDVEDKVYIVAENDEGLVITIRLNFCTQPSRRIIIVRGAKGEIITNLLKGEIILNSIDKTESLIQNNYNYNYNYKLQIDNFIECIEGLAEPICSFQDGVNVLELIAKVREKSNLNC
ncbi:Gfo/Idh/MocA family protein [Prochlorococcus sp. MIT 1011]|uniref:Gfo/Idh/MocA family protein n=1 Tax=Prochlorococcus sp. MIT 1011 TaxID=3082520 RepID=UPI0039B5F8AF